MITARPSAAELTDEQREYLASFKAAMEAIDARVKADAKRKRGVPKVYRELVSGGYWRPDVIAFEFALCTRKLCSLSARQREYILQVGAVAKEIHDKNRELKRKDDKKDEKGKQ